MLLQRLKQLASRVVAMVWLLFGSSTTRRHALLVVFVAAVGLCVPKSVPEGSTALKVLLKRHKSPVQAASSPCIRAQQMLRATVLVLLAVTAKAVLHRKFRVQQVALVPRSLFRRATALTFVPRAFSVRWVRPAQFNVIRCCFVRQDCLPSPHDVQSCGR
jgi:hypothetical protein